MTKSKKIISIICAVAIVLLLLYFVPFPTRIDLDVEGMQVDQDGAFVANVDITLDGWRLNYLFKDDALKVKAEIEKDDSLVLSYGHNPSASRIFRFEEATSYALVSVYLPKENRANSVTLAFEKDFRSFLIKTNNKSCYFFAEDSQLSAKDLYNIYLAYMG